MELVHICSSRKITQERDRLPTLSGIAAALQERGFGDYLAGIWKRDLPAQLLWSSTMNSESKRTPTYRAPTWSFASLEHIGVRNALEHTFPSERTFLSKVDSVECTPAGPDGNGILANAHITLTGPCQESILKYRCSMPSSTADKPGKTNHFVECFNTLHAFSCDFNLLDLSQTRTSFRKLTDTQSPNDDHDPPPNKTKEKLIPLAVNDGGANKTPKGEEKEEEELTGGPVLLLAICNEAQTQFKMHGKGVESLYCLVLRRKGDDGLVTENTVVYERIGLLVLSRDGEPGKWLEGAEVRSLMIV